MTTAEKIAALQESRDRIAVSGQWAQGGLAFTTLGGFLTTPCDSAARCWCAIGSICKTLGINALDTAEAYRKDKEGLIRQLDLVGEDLFYYRLPYLNDGEMDDGHPPEPEMSFSQVMTVFDTAIARLKEQVVS